MSRVTALAPAGLPGRRPVQDTAPLQPARHSGERRHQLLDRDMLGAVNIQHYVLNIKLLKYRIIAARLMQEFERKLIDQIFY